MAENKILKQLETRVARTYSGGKLLDEFSGNPNPADTQYPEDWISSFVAAKNKIVTKNEGITRVETADGVKLITEVVEKSDFGNGRTDAGVLIKYLDSAERLGIQVHPTKEFAKNNFGVPYGKNECWHILNTRRINGENACIYIGFKEFVTREYFKNLFLKQDIRGMLDCLHKFEVNIGDTVLVRGGMPHAIGAGCFLLEIQEPTDYTLRVERTTVGGDILSDNQMHYGLGFDKMLDCFDYTPRTREETKRFCFLTHETSLENGYEKTVLADYRDTPCFKLEKIRAKNAELRFNDFLTLIALSDGNLMCGKTTLQFKKSDKFFVSAAAKKITLNNAEVLVCYPPEKGEK